MSLPSGLRLGPYQIVQDLGAGGMGEVYRARDERLGRDVALKVLPAELAADPDRRRRFEREARAVAALNHPNVVVIHDVGEAEGIAFLVTELLDGETLRERLRRGPLPWRRAAEYCAAVADALAAAHQRGIVHRDVKPENLFVTRDDAVKVLDFGLAKDQAVAGQASEAPTLTAATAAGVVLGTPGYLSPEQARGEPVDARTDVFSLGCVLFESLTGRRAFEGQTASDLVASLLRDDAPDAASLRPDLPDKLARIAQRCLCREREGRFQSARDLAFALRLVSRDGSASAGMPAAGRWPGRGAVAAAVALVALGAAGGYGLHGRLPRGRPGESPRVLQLTAGATRESSPVISPDGTFVAYLASDGARTDVWLKFVQGGPGVNLTAASGLEIQSQTMIGGLDISPDSRLIAVRAGPPDEPSSQRGVWVVPAPLGGPMRKLVSRAGGLRFSPDGERIAYMRPNPALGDSIVVARADGSDERVVLPARPGYHTHEPAWSADGGWIYFDRGVQPNNEPPTEIWRVPSAGGTAERVLDVRGVARSPEPVQRGLLYAGDQGGGAFNLWWRPFAGGAERRLTLGAGEYVSPRVARAGTRVVCEARANAGSLRTLDLLAPGEPPTGPLTTGGHEDAAPSVARSGRLAFSSARNGTQDIWTSDADGANPRPLTSDAEPDRLPAISPDGRHVAFVSHRGGRTGLWLGATDGGALRSLATVDVVDRPSWSAAGDRLVFAAEGSDGRFGLWVVAAAGGAPVAVPGASGRSPSWSPVADVIAYFTSEPEGLRIRFVDSRGEPQLRNLDVTTSALQSAAFSWDGRRLAVGIAPGSGGSEIAVIDLESGRARRVLRCSPTATLRGLGWTPEGRLVYGLGEYESRVLLLDGLALE